MGSIIAPFAGRRRALGKQSGGIVGRNGSSLSTSPSSPRRTALHWQRLRLHLHGSRSTETLCAHRHLANRTGEASSLLSDQRGGGGGRPTRGREKEEKEGGRKRVVFSDIRETPITHARYFFFVLPAPSPAKLRSWILSAPQRTHPAAASSFPVKRPGQNSWRTAFFKFLFFPHYYLQLEKISG